MMTNKQICKVMEHGIPVTVGSDVYPRVLDYRIRFDANGDPVCTAGCVDAGRFYREIPCNQLSCEHDLRGVKYRAPKWASAYSVDEVKDAIKSGTPVTVNGMRFRHIESLLIRRINTEPNEPLQYVVGCVDENENRLYAKADRITLQAE